MSLLNKLPNVAKHKIILFIINFRKVSNTYDYKNVEHCISQIDDSLHDFIKSPWFITRQYNVLDIDRSIKHPYIKKIVPYIKYINISNEIGSNTIRNIASSLRGHCIQFDVNSKRMKNFIPNAKNVFIKDPINFNKIKKRECVENMTLKYCKVTHAITMSYKKFPALKRLNIYFNEFTDVLYHNIDPLIIFVYY